MRIMAGALGGTNNNEVKVVTVNKIKNKLQFLGARTLPLYSFIQKVEKNTFVTCEYVDVVSLETEMPPMNDAKSFNLLAKNKLSNQLQPGVDYIFAYNEVLKPHTSAEAQKSSIMKNYNIYAVPSKLLEEYNGGNALVGKVPFLTLDQFSMVAFSERVAEDKVVCHAFADKNQLLITFSVGKNLLYSRTSPIPKVFEKKEERINFYYETINLTYVYMRQSRQVTVDRLVFSGLLKHEKELESSVSAFAGHDVEYLKTDNYVDKCREDIFDEYLLALGACLTGSDFNFIPATDTAKIAYREALLYANAAAVVLVVVAAVLFFWQVGKYFVEKNDIVKRQDKLTRTLNELSTAIGDQAELSYYNAYTGMLQEKEKSPISNIAKAQVLLNRDIYGEVDFVKNAATGKNVVAVRKQTRFDTYLNSYDFQSLYNAYVDNFEALSPELYSRLKIADKTYDMNTLLLETD